MRLADKKSKDTTFEKDRAKKKKTSIDIPGGLGTETVLLVDDDDLILEVGERLLKTMGYKVLKAESGEEAIQIYKKNKNKIEILILDMIMPDKDGGEIYDILKKINPGIKVLLSSGYNIDGQAAEILNRGCNGFIQKPFRMKDLSRKLREILDG